MADLQEYKEPPAFNAPSVVIALVAAIFAVFLLQAYGGREMSGNLLIWGSLIPARYAPAVDGNLYFFPGGILADLWTFITYAFLHGGWTHVIFNSIWLLAFGTPVARRIGTARFLTFYLICAIIGGITHVVIYAGELTPVVGASAAVSGLMGGAARFVFLAGGPLGMIGTGQTGLPGAPRAQASILQALTDRRTLIFIAIWIGMNLLFGITGLTPSGQIVSVAWEAHLGGFFAGLLLFGFFDPIKTSPSGGPGNVGYGEWKG